ncbi:MAG: outer membrane protein assembly factor BamA [Alphaproteobacteria bacterium]|nr:outer membrane protein assembly factor BamA [Alphaproteobacteria bacterium]
MSRGFLLALLWVVIGAGTASAAPPAPAEGTVTKVVVDGNRRIEEAVVLAAVGIRRGERVDPEKIKRDIRAVWGTGYFDDVVVELLPDGDGQVQVHFVVVEKPAVRDVRLVGHKKVDEDDLREVLDVRAFTVLNEAKVADNVQKLRDVYVDKGYYLVEIEPTYEPAGNDQVDVVFNITENRKVVVQRVEFTGNDHVAAGKIKRFLQIKEAGFLPFLTQSGTFKRDALEADQQTVNAVFLEEGYLDVKVEAPKVYLSPDKRYIYVHYDVTEGEQYTLGQIDVTGDFVQDEGLTEVAALQVVAGRQVPDIQEEQWRKAEGKKKRLFAFELKGPRLQTGEVFRYSEMHTVRQNLESLWQDQGYAFVNVVPDIRPDPATHTADVTYAVGKGEKVRIGRINITGNDPTFDKVVRREIQIDEGEIYRGSLIRASKQRLMRLGYFEDVVISTPRGDGDNVLDMNVQVTERPTGSFSLGLGYSNLESLTFNFSVQKNNFLGLGYLMSGAVNWSKLRRQGSLSLFDPYFLDSRWTASIDAFYISQQFQVQNDEYRRGGTLSIGRYLDPRNDMQLRLQYTIEDVGLQNIDAFRLRLYGGDLYRNGMTSTVGTTLSIDKRNDRIFPTRGILTNISTALSGGFRLNEDQVLSMFGGDFNFIETKVNFRLYQPIVPRTDRVVFRMNLTFGDIRSTDGREIAFIHRYRAGGIQSLRGFQWYSLGPSIRVPNSDDPTRADDKLIVGGTETWTNNFEIESSIVPQAGISGVVFFDAGNAFRGPGGTYPLNPLDLRTSIGAGIRWRSPIGPLRFELGFPLAPQPGEKPSVFDFGIGSFF